MERTSYAAGFEIFETIESPIDRHREIVLMMMLGYIAHDNTMGLGYNVGDFERAKHDYAVHAAYRGSDESLGMLGNKDLLVNMDPYATRDLALNSITGYMEMETARRWEVYNNWLIGFDREPRDLLEFEEGDILLKSVGYDVNKVKRRVDATVKELLIGGYDVTPLHIARIGFDEIKASTHYQLWHEQQYLEGEIKP